MHAHARMPDGEGLASRVARALEGVPRHARRLGIDANGGWMLLIKTQLAQLADELKFEVHAPAAAPSRDGDQPGLERLVDLAWSATLSDGQEPPRLPLVLDFGWHSNRDEQIGADFQELLLARAELCVMVFQQRTAAAVQAIMDALERQARAVHAPGAHGVYLLCGYDWEDTRQFAFRTFATT